MRSFSMLGDGYVGVAPGTLSLRLGDPANSDSVVAIYAAADAVGVSHTTSTDTQDVANVANQVLLVIGSTAQISADEVNASKIAPDFQLIAEAAQRGARNKWTTAFVGGAVGVGVGLLLGW